MESYVKGETKEVEEELSPFADLDVNAVAMRVNAGSRISNVLGFALKKMKEPETHHITWNGSGHAINKTISCAEIMKRKIKGLHQITRVRSRRIEEYWEPKVEGLERLKVNRDIPAISILLSKEALDSNLPGYQAPGCKDPAWSSRANDSGQNTVKSATNPHKRKRKRKEQSEKADKGKQNSKRQESDKPKDSEKSRACEKSRASSGKLKSEKTKPSEKDTPPPDQSS